MINHKTTETNFEKVVIKEVDGRIATADLDYQILANFIFNETKYLGELEACELYKHRVLDVDAGVHKH